MGKGIKTEHAGAKNGGGHWGPRAEAKALSKSKRRMADKKAERIVREVQDEVKTYHVPVIATYSGHMTVEASSPKEAVAKAEEQWEGIKSIEGYSFDFDFAESDEVEEAEEDDD